MKKTFLLLAVAVLMVDSSGCCLCKKKAQPVPVPAMTQCAPTCTPTNPQGYNSYGTGMAPATTFSAPPSSINTLPAGGY